MLGRERHIATAWAVRLDRFVALRLLAMTIEGLTGGAGLGRPRFLANCGLSLRLTPDSARAGLARGGIHGPMTSPALAFLPAILFTVLTNAAAQIMLKRGMMSVGALDIGADGLVWTVLKVVFSPFVFLGLATFVISMASHLYVLSKVQLSYAYPFLSLAYVVVAAYSYFFFAEDLNAARIAGIGLIVAGTILIAQS